MDCQWTVLCLLKCNRTSNSNCKAIAVAIVVMIAMVIEVAVKTVAVAVAAVSSNSSGSNEGSCSSRSMQSGLSMDCAMLAAVPDLSIDVCMQYGASEPILGPC